MCLYLIPTLKPAVLAELKTHHVQKILEVKITRQLFTIVGSFDKTLKIEGEQKTSVQLVILRERQET